MWALECGLGERCTGAKLRRILLHCPWAAPRFTFIITEGFRLEGISGPTPWIFFYYCALVRLSYKCGSRSCRFRRKTANHQIHNKTISVSNTVCISENLSKAQSWIKMELRLKRDLRNPSLILFFFFFPRISVSPQGGGSQYFSLKTLHLCHFARPGTECLPFSMMDPSMLLCPVYKTRT